MDPSFFFLRLMLNMYFGIMYVDQPVQKFVPRVLINNSMFIRMNYENENLNIHTLKMYEDTVHVILDLCRYVLNRQDIWHDIYCLDLQLDTVNS